MNKTIRWLKQKRAYIATVVGVSVVSVAGVCGAEEPELDLTAFELTDIFQHGQVIIDALLPLAMIALGVGLGFIVLRYVRSLF